MTELRIMRGVPASGKSTVAAELVKRGYARVNRDDIRFAMYGAYWGKRVDEDAVTEAENAMITANLRAGRNTVVDATNLNNKALRAKLSLASRYGAEVRYHHLPISLYEAIYRDDRRERKVGPVVLTDFFKRYKIDPETGEMKPPPEPLPVFEPYTPNINKPAAFIIDTDGTLADHEGVRSPYDTSKYAEDKVHEHMASVADALGTHGFTVIALSGRDEEFAPVTFKWWTDVAEVVPDYMFFRPKGDRRMDAIIKYELFKRHIEPKFNVFGAFDDRPQVIRMWETIGVPVFRVGPGLEF